MSINYDYSPHWNNLGSVLLYNHPNFQFNSVVIIVEFEECLINRLPPGQLYHAIDPKIISPYNEEFIKIIKKECTDVGIIIVSHIFGAGKLVIDSLKRKAEAFYEKYNIPALAFFVLTPNKFSKPHTGMWLLINSFYKKNGHMITKACVVSDFGGRLVERETKAGKVLVMADRTDIDRAFAHNIGIPYKTISEYLNPETTEKFSWNNICMAPDYRKIYVEKLTEYVNPSIFKELFKTGPSDSYLIMVYGAPRSGKTTLCELLVKQWRKSKLGESRAIERVGRDKYSKITMLSTTKKYMIDHISVIIDGECHTDKLRLPYIELADKYKINYIIIEVNPGINMAYLFNHVAVESASNENVVLYNPREFYYYNSIVIRPANAILYCPEIQQSKQLMEFRY
jgi:hypothetical protein